MKKLLFTFLFLLIAGTGYSQWVFQSMDNSVGGAFWDTTTIYDNGQGTAKLALSDDPDHYEGTGSLKVDYTVGAGDGWGGYVVRVVPPLDDYIDLSTGTEMSFWYKVITPVVKSQDGTAFMEIKLGDYNEDGLRDLWYHETKVDLSDASGQWINVRVPLTVTGNKTTGLQNQFADGDGELQLDKIKGFEIALVFITVGGTTPTPTASGVFLMDKWELVGNRYEPLTTFDNDASGVFNVDFMEWAGDAGKGSVALTNNTTDKVEGAASLQLDYTVNASQDWGGYVNMTKPLAVVPDSFNNRTALAIFVKNVTPHQSVLGKRLSFRFFISEKSDGTNNEDWVIEVPVKLNEASEWTRYILPLVEKPTVFDADSVQHFPSNGFAQTWWNQTGDRVFNPELITSWKIELSALGNADGGTQGEKMTGTVLFDILQTSGFKFDDKEAPAAPAGVTGLPGTYSNLVTWTDVPGETDERYSIYFSKSAFTDINAPGVELAKKGILGDIQVYDHLIRSPLVDREATYYYAVVATDKAGNVGLPGLSSAVTNTEKGIATVSLVAPNFVADGDLAEWSHIKPFTMYPSQGTAFAAQNKDVTNDADASGDCYVAIDNTYLYVAFNINDDIIFDDPADYASGNTWTIDSPDMFIGLYNGAEHKHVAYQRGSQPDYQLRFNKLMARNDDFTNETDSLLLPGENYYWGEKFPPGYIIEARIPLADLAYRRDDPSKAIDTINVREGFRIPFDWAINDNDGLNGPDRAANREGLIFWSPFNRDAGHNDVSVWMYTWIGNTDVVGITDEGIVPDNYSLEQNFPNPFNPTTQIRYSIPSAGMVSLKIYDVLGSEVGQLINQYQNQGTYTVDFNASSLGSGVYIYQIESGSFRASKKMILIK